MDNSVDFVSSSDKKEVQPLRQWLRERHGEKWTQTHTQLPVAEHGVSMLIRVFTAETSCSVLFDTGVSAEGVILNARRMGIDLGEVAYVALSHGHYDHFGGLKATVQAINNPKLTIILHEDMVKQRGALTLKGTIRKHPEFPKIGELKPASIINTKQPYLIADGTVCVTGEISRETSFETGYSHNRILNGNTWQPDPLIIDDRALVINVKDKGLVIVSGCAHAGIINTIRYAQQITGVTRVYAVIGGFHLAGKDYESRIERTMAELKSINPKLIITCHCTGWRANHAIATEFPDAFVPNSVGNLYQL